MNKSSEPRSVSVIVGENNYDFHSTLSRHGKRLQPVSMETLQVNVTKLCNQACHHCHVDASPKRTEQMDRRTVDRCLEILSEITTIRNLDITGGAPELNPHFDYFVEEARKLDRHVMVRHNLTVIFDGNPVTGESKQYLPEFYSRHGVEIIASLPCYTASNTDSQRGKGVFQKSIEALQLLNRAGYGDDGSGLQLNLVFNPLGSSLPSPQHTLEADYKRELLSQFGIRFNKLYTMTNMPIHRFKEWLDRTGAYHSYMDKIVDAFNPAAADNIMCRSMLSVGYDGSLYDCDFNQMLNLQIGNGIMSTIFNMDFQKILDRDIMFDSHCFGCTAGAGSSCTGATS